MQKRAAHAFDEVADIDKAAKSEGHVVAYSHITDELEPVKQPMEVLAQRRANKLAEKKADEKVRESLVIEASNEEK